jgi:hypothetical protein
MEFMKMAVGTAEQEFMAMMFRISAQRSLFTRIFTSWLRSTQWPPFWFRIYRKAGYFIMPYGINSELSRPWPPGY